MHAKVGDYLVVKGTTTERHDQAPGEAKYLGRCAANSR